ncbi:MAG: hypothetical protein ABI595_12185 [Actinomycetota bacterium]
MDHTAHEPGTVPDCPECRAFSYEPGWYRSLRAEHASGREPLVIPEAARLEIVLPEADHSDLVVPELEDTRPEDEDR